MTSRTQTQLTPLDLPGLQMRADGSLLTVELTRPAAGNLFTADMLKGFTQAFDVIEKTGPEVVVFRGRGPHFSLGRDHNDGSGPAEVMPLLRHITEMVPRIPAVTIAAVQGRAYGLGAGLATMSDIAIATETSRLAFDETTNGVVPTFVLSYLERSVGPKLAFEMIATGRPLTAHEALTAGLLTRVVPDERLDEAVTGLVAELLMKKAGVLRGVKEYTLDVAGIPQPDRMPFALERAVFYASGGHLQSATP